MVDKYAENSKYIVEEMESSNDDYKLIKKSFEGTIDATKYNVETHKIYRVNERNSGEKQQQKSDNMLLFHGTNRKNAIGILEEGFRPSTNGRYGPGVYHTSVPDTAHFYSFSGTNLYKIENNGEEQNVLLCVFVNEILDLEKLKKGTKYIVNGTGKNDLYKTFEKDSNGRKIRTFQTVGRDYFSHCVCNKKFVIPRYFIELFSN